MASVREIARQAGVSKTTVSMVLRHETSVSEVMRQRVQEAIDYLRTLEEARAAEEIAPAVADQTNGLSKEDINSSLLVLHPMNINSSAVFHEIIRGIQAAAALYKLQLNLAFNDANLLGDNFETLYFSNSYLRPRGIIVIGARINEPVVDRACTFGVPIVMVGRHASANHVSSVGRNEEEAACEAVNYLLDLGHTQIAFIGGSEKYSYTHDRVRGYQKAFAERGLTVPPNLCLTGYDQAAAAKLILDHPELTAIVFIHELYASQVLSLIQAAGKRIPEDYSVITFDDTEISKTFDPPLTTMAYPFYQEGFWAVRLLMEQIRQPTIANINMVLRGTLLKRKSCGPPKQ